VPAIAKIWPVLLDEKLWPALLFIDKIWSPLLAEETWPHLLFIEKLWPHGTAKLSPSGIIDDVASLEQEDVDSPDKEISPS
jgi:hypothetical protein